MLLFDLFMLWERLQSVCNLLGTVWFNRIKKIYFMNDNDIDIGSKVGGSS